jgi:peptide-methionine (S)-S-oxide reductase
MGDHAETIQIDFDPKQISYEYLLELFWTSHNPCRNAWSRQYMSAVFYHDEGQQKAIENTRRQFVKTPEQVQTEIAPMTKFWIAEDYHQKYRLRHTAAIDSELHAIYPNESDYVNSTAAARLNGFLDRYGEPDQLEQVIEKLGLSTAAQDLLRKHVH